MAPRGERFQLAVPASRALLMIAASACAPTPENIRAADGGRAAGAPHDGLTHAWSEPIAPTRSGTAHLTRLLLRGDWLYGANSSAGVTAWRIDPRGRMTFESSTEPSGTGGPPQGPATLPRCVALSAHPSAPWLYCSAADSGVSRFDLNAPDHPAVREHQTLSASDGTGRPAVHALRDALLIAAFDRGLLRAPLDAQGAAGEAVVTPVTGDVVNVDGDGDTLAALHRARGLLSLRASGASITTRGALALDGPPLGLRVRQRRAVVALGAAGVWLVDLADDAPRVLRRVRPPCVSTLGDVSGDALAVACSTGAWLYDLRSDPPRVAGFAPARYGVLDALLRDNGRQLVVADWRDVDVYDVDVTGHALVPDVAHGSVLLPGTDVTIAARNPGDLPLTLLLNRWVEDPKKGRVPTTIEQALVGPGEVHRFALPDRVLREWWDPTEDVFELQVVSSTNPDPATSRTGEVRLLRVSPEVPPQRRPLAEGEPFWSLRAREGTSWPAAIPAGGDGEVAMLLPDCALQWGAIEDLAWRVARGEAAASVLTVDTGRALSPSERASVIARLNAAPLGVWPLSDFFTLPPGTGSTGALFDGVLSARRLGGADMTEVYRVRGGVLRSTERIYRGASTLR